MPTALTFRGNVGPDGRHIDDPELRAATYLTKALRRRGIHVGGPPDAGVPGETAVKIAAVGSAPVIDILHRMDVDSINFDAEVLGKVLGAEVSGTGSIAAGAAAIDAFTAAHGAPGFEHRDASGLSYADRATAQGMVRLLWAADKQPWATDLRLALPIGGQGTLEGRLGHTRIRAKTGTLTDISALSGWVWSRDDEGLDRVLDPVGRPEQGRGGPDRGRDRAVGERPGEGARHLTSRRVRLQVDRVPHDRDVRAVEPVLARRAVPRPAGGLVEAPAPVVRGHDPERRPLVAELGEPPDG